MPGTPIEIQPPVSSILSRILHSLNQRAPGRMFAVAIAVGLVSAATTAHAQLDVDASLGNSPYTVSAAAGYTTIVVGDTSTGVLNDSAYTLTASSTTVIGNVAGSNGTYNLSGTGGLTASNTVTVGNAGTGLFNQTGGTLTMTGHSMVLGGASGAAGTYTMSGAAASASMVTAFLGNVSGATGTVNVSAGTLNFTGSIDDGYLSGATGAFNISGGTVSTAANVYDGYQANADINLTGGTLNVTGNFDMSHSASNAHSTLEVATGATLNLKSSTSLFLIGELGIGTVNMSGGAINDSGTSAVIIGGNTVATGKGTVNLSGGTLDASLAGVKVGNLGTGTVTQTGGTFKTGSAGVIIGSLSGSTGTYTLTLGTLSAGSVTGGAGTSTLNLNGGTLQATASTTTFVQSLTTANVQAGGAVIDSNTFNLTIAQNLLHDTTVGAKALDGGLTKLSAGTLTLTGANTYTGVTFIGAGSVVAAVNGALGAGNVSLAANAVLSISSGVTAPETNFGTTLTLASATTSIVNLAGTGVQDTVAALIINGVTVPAGTYGALGSGATFTLFPDFTGTGEVLVIPEPSTWALLCLGGVGLLGLTLRPRRTGRA